MSNRVNLDDLQYDWPPNVMQYEARLFWGISILDAMAAMLIAIALGAVFHLGLGIVGGLLGLLLVRKYDALNDRRPHEYLTAWLRHRLTRQAVSLPLILPPARLDFEFVQPDDLPGFEDETP